MSVAGVVIPARYEEWFRVSYLSMEPALASAYHSFTFGGERVKITLPPTPAFEDFNLSRAKASVSKRRAATNEPVEIYIYAVLVTITELEFRIPVAAAKYQHENSSLYTEDQRL
jgi:hypothetical protein